jgi:hypothetical protein
MGHTFNGGAVPRRMPGGLRHAVYTVYGMVLAVKRVETAVFIYRSKYISYTKKANGVWTYVCMSLFVISYSV